MMDCNTCVHDSVCMYKENIHYVVQCIDDTFANSGGKAFEQIREHSLISYSTKCKLHEYKQQRFTKYDIKEMLDKYLQDENADTTAYLALALMEVLYKEKDGDNVVQ